MYCYLRIGLRVLHVRRVDKAFNQVPYNRMVAAIKKFMKPSSLGSISPGLGLGLTVGGTPLRDVLVGGGKSEWGE